jgi:hypothetical protein
MTYIIKGVDAAKINKFGVDITFYGEQAPSNLVYEEVLEGHFEEFYNDISTHMWFIFEGKGTFVIDDQKFEVTAKDLVVVPPKKRIHYFGGMKMVLITTPAWEEKNEHHVRDVDLIESPYHEKGVAQ